VFGKIDAPNVEIKSAQEFIDEAEKNIVRCADPATAEEMIEYIDSTANKAILLAAR